MGLSRKMLMHEAAAALDAVSWRLLQRGLWSHTANAGYFNSGAEPTRWFDNREWAAALGRAANKQIFRQGSVGAGTAQQVETTPQSTTATGKRKVLAATGLVTTCMSIALGGIAWRESSHILTIAPRMAAIPAISADGFAIGALPRNDVLITRTADGKAVVRITTPSQRNAADFLKGAGLIEGHGIFGVDPINIVRAGFCTGASKLGFRNLAILHQRGSRCGGASTLLQQAVRGIDDDRAYSISRKARHIVGAMGVAARLDGEAEDRFILDHLFFGFAEGQPIYGLTNAAKSIFGKSIETEDLELHESAYLAGLLFHPVALGCGAQKGNDALWKDQIDRGLIALKAFENDLRYVQSREALKNMRPITSPAPDALAQQFGFPDQLACIAGASPILKLEMMASTAGRAARQELNEAPLPNGAHLTVSLREQSALVSGISDGLNQIQRTQGSIWHASPSSTQIFALRTDTNGAITSAYRKSAMSQIDKSLEIGSIAKLYALAILAETGWGTRPFCNRAAVLNGKQLHNSGGDKGSKHCIGAALKTGAEVWGRSLSLAVYDALRQQDQGLLHQRMKDWGVEAAPTDNLAYQLAFGLIRVSPRKLSAFVSSVSSGAADQPPVGYLPHALAGGSANARPFVDLSAAFNAPGGRALIETASGAAFNFRGPRGTGTLAGLGPARGAVGKTGTLDDEEGNVRFKGAVGGYAGSTWIVLMQPTTGSLGGDDINILPLVRAVKDAGKGK